MERSVPEPLPQQASRGPNPHLRGRWRWWYSVIVDYRILHPGCTNEEVAAHVKKHPNTISLVMQSDLYKEYEAQRRAAHRERTEAELRLKLTGVTLRALDSLEVQFEKKRDQVPLQIAKEVAAMGLEQLGFGPKQAPAVVVNNHQQNVTLQGVSAAALEEARMALRAVEAQKALPKNITPIFELEAKPDSSVVSTTSEGLEPGDDADASTDVS